MSFSYSIFFLAACISIFFPKPTLSDDIDIEFTSVNEAHYCGSNFDGEFFDHSTGSITGFRDLSEPNAIGLDAYYYFISDYDSSYILRPITIISDIFDENGKEFDNTANNVIARQLPYENYVSNQSLFNFGQGLRSCMNPYNYDILLCFEMEIKGRGTVECIIFDNNIDNPKWSNKINVDSNEIFDVTSFEIECLHDAYLIMFSHLGAFGHAPNTRYTLLDLDGNIKINSKRIFNETQLNVTEIFPSPWLRSHQDHGTYETSNSVRTQLILAANMGGYLGRFDSFFLEYSNISDINISGPGIGPIYPNYGISGKRLFTYDLLASERSVPVSGMKYFELNAATKCCYMASYIKNKHETDPLDMDTMIYLSIIDGNGNKMFENDTLIIDHIENFFAYDYNISTSVHQLNININDTNGSDRSFFAVIFNDEMTLYIQIISINAMEKELILLDKIELMDIEDIPKIDANSGFLNVYVDSELKYEENIIFFMYQLFLVSDAYNSSGSTGDFVQSWTYEVNN